MRLTDESRVLDGKVHEARAGQSRALLERLEWQHEKEVLQRHCQRLNQELSQKLEAHASLRSSSSAEVGPGWPCSTTLLQCASGCVLRHSHARGLWRVSGLCLGG